MSDSTARPRGIDVSHFQANIDWRAVKRAGISFAYAKATEGTDYVDPRFADNWQDMKEIGVVRGAYLFLQPDQDPIQQAKHFLSRVKWENDADLPHALDVETFGNKTREEMRTLIAEAAKPLEDAMGRKVVIYCSPGQWDGNVGGGGFSGHPLWIASIGRRSTPHLSKDWSSWVFWQYAWSAHYAGVSSNADADCFNGTLADLQAFVKSGS